MSNFDSNIIKNPEIFEQNRLAAHSDHVCYKNELEKIIGKSSLRYDMNGLWKFAYAKNQSLAPCGFEAADYDCKGWDEITEIFGKLGLRICNSFADFSGKPSSDNDIQFDGLFHTRIKIE